MVWEGGRLHGDSPMTKTQALYLVAVLRFQTLRYRLPITKEGRARLSKLGRALGLKPSRARDDGRDRRVFWRSAVRWPVTIMAGGRRASAQVVDVGPGGLRVAGADWLLRGAGGDGEATVRLVLPNSDVALDLPVEVRHRDPTNASLGLRFCGAPQMP